MKYDSTVYQKTKQLNLFSGRALNFKKESSSGKENSQKPSIVNYGTVHQLATGITFDTTGISETFSKIGKYLEKLEPLMILCFGLFSLRVLGARVEAWEVWGTIIVFSLILIFEKRQNGGSP